MAIETFIFFDLETTGLIEGKIMPRIMELALVAVTRKSIYSSNRNSPPRVLHKLVIPVNPQKIVSSKVEYLTKLSNEDLQLLQPFNCDIYELIMRFLQRLIPPVCFAAHNGNGFDYPIFLWELACINKVLNNEILCIDTWKMFQDFFKKENLESRVIQDLLNDEYNDVLSVLNVDVITKEIKDVTTSESCHENVVTSQSTVTLYNGSSKIINKGKYDTKGKYGDSTAERSMKHAKQRANERTPESQIIRTHNVFVDRPLKSNPRKRLDFESAEKPASLKLSAIYEHMFSSNLPNQHSAEADCLAMIRCVNNIADFFLSWSDNHAIPLSRCKKT
ncbi:hypothetical protein DMN91_004423 [Ooceraea biroi]|uniref:Three prime repair exonuclease n=1 Tax=Ooceraea biroi TaxID=2015173 RepID=A0A026W0J2_OOCBI|nr:uncharacterized protein LOC105284614 [Ooceraea biroi]XP_011346577.1 uncharacterized protein LOC105284614 [Ooceraea biroi]XP_011346578.1 uncharacterized protein LOC105284614 [Ooceraea biroi]XP_026824563.1 uncharacterized protein LOC105284614 [Ooceraea biroi]EZA49510.1 Three prime repair exonuclease [Ooceraea biroi]RLU24213.1 hypothetical protein DMN91_004423 [Ooceraea biroi]